MSPEVVALLVLAAGAVAAVAFTLLVVLTVDRSDANRRRPAGGEGAPGRDDEAG